MNGGILELSVEVIVALIFVWVFFEIATALVGGWYAILFVILMVLLIAAIVMEEIS